MYYLRKKIRKAVKYFGFELLHYSNDVVLSRMLSIYNALRLSKNALLWDDLLPTVASLSHLRNLIVINRIDLVIDIGANYGQFAAQLRSLGYKGEIVSFEPLARYREKLEVDAEADGNWRFYPLALGGRDDELELTVSSSDDFSSLHETNALGESRFGEMMHSVSKEMVSVKTLDGLWEEIIKNPGRKILLKTDTQGHDLEVLRGGSKALAAICTVVAEISFQPIYKNSPKSEEIIGELSKYGFVLSGIYPISHTPEDMLMIEADAYFVKKSISGLCLTQ